MPPASELEFVPATDPALDARVWNALNPDDLVTTELAAHWWQQMDLVGSFQRFAIRVDLADAGYAMVGHLPWEDTDERFARLEADLLPEQRTPARLHAGHEFVERRAIDLGARDLLAHVRESDPVSAAVLVSHGYSGDRFFRWSELDLVSRREHLEALARSSRQRMREVGVELLTLDSIDRSEALWQELADLRWEANQDTPRDEPALRASAEAVRGWLEAPGVDADRTWLARKQGRLVGVSYLEYRDGGPAWTGWTGTARSIRGQGVARTLKLETVLQAAALGVTRCRTENDAENAPILHLNDEFGYEAIPGQIQFHRRVGG